jgi:hypothetical protein
MINNLEDNALEAAYHYLKELDWKVLPRSKTFQELKYILDQLSRQCFADSRG